MDPQSEADKIRNKRLAKLGGSSAPASGPESPKTEPPKDGPSETSTPVHAKPSTIFAENDGPAKKIKITPLPTPSQQPSATILSKAKLPAVPDSPEQLTDRILSTVFRVTVRSDQNTDAFGNKLTFLPGVREQLESDGKAALLQLDTLDTAIIEAGSSTSDGRPFGYLLASFKRIMRAFRTSKHGDSAEIRGEVLKEAKRMCFSYCIFAATMPYMFEAEETDRNILADHFLRDPDSDGGICPDFLTEAMLRWPGEDDTIKHLLVGAVEQISADLSKMTMNDNYKPSMLALRTCSLYPTLLDAITESSKFLPTEVPIERFEYEATLGPFFSLSPLHPNVALSYFIGSQAQGQSFVVNNQAAIRLTLRTHQDELLEIINRIVKSGKAQRERLLDWFAHVINKNHKRRATWRDDKIISTDGFMVNITTILDRLCEPFMDHTFTKVDRIDVKYLRRNPRIEIADETKINADQKTSDEFYATKVDGENNFISEVFFLTVAAHHYGTEALHAYLTKLEREIKHFEKEVAKMETQRSRYATQPQNLVIFERHLKRFKDQLEKTRCLIEAIRGVMLDEQIQARSMLLMRYVITWLLRIVQPGSDYPKTPIKLPLPENQSQTFACLPEYLLEDIVDNFKFVTSHMPQVIQDTQCEELVTVCVTFLRSSEYVKNPYLKAGLVSILFHGVYAWGRKPKGTLGDLLSSSEFCHQHLLHALMNFYIEAESTGGHNQFYDKFNIRYEIFQVIRCIWGTPIYRKNLETESKVNVDFFVRFVNLLMNDVTYVMGEAFRAFQEIHTIQELLKKPDELDETQRKEKEEQLEQLQRQAKGNMQLTNETVSMLKLFTEVLAKPFTMPEIVQRLADMLDYNLEQMVGPKQGQLKVENQDTYHFNPLALLSDLMSVYVNLGTQPSFLLAVARDGRSYKPANFDQAISIMKRKSFKSPEELAQFKRLAKKIEQVRAADQQEEEELGEIPDEFLDPITADLMRDPVILPSSRQVLDRDSIRAMLLNDPIDPFNRMPLKIEDVIPNDELKAKIQAFKDEAKVRNLKAVQEEDVSMEEIETEEGKAEEKMDLE